ncbi:unnamed protein product [Brachionus calyciflorus]|uniref:Protein kinase domain-containing protein n=1 Tax=Brachionus calyciflorus TaxID=104777 RepID=A0A813UGE2_9BILA|nr:unnamed protein product [Brachionus calyciflorus]
MHSFKLDKNQIKQRSPLKSIEEAFTDDDSINLDSIEFSTYLDNLLEKENSLIEKIQGSFESQSYDVPIFQLSDLEVDENTKIKYGSTSTVQKAFILNQNLPVAVKKYKLKNTESFKNEIKILKKISHENVLRLIGVMNDQNDSIITDWCSGPNLYEFLNSKHEDCYDKSNMFELMDIAYQISNAMDYLHSLRILHRDLKSKNVFLTESKNSENGLAHWQVKIGDFNLAICLDDANVQKIQTRCEGSYYWMAPEIINKKYNDQVINNPYTFKSDVYSFGIIMYELITGNLPFKDLDPMVMVLKVGRRSLKLDPRPIPNTPKGAVEIVKICTDSNRDIRPDFKDIKSQLFLIKNESSRNPLKKI